jgi:predicted enzyme related to lactoylglutathione lyase
MPRPLHFEIHASDTARARKFYESLFGWTFQKWEGGAVEYWMIVTGPEGTPGINGGMLKRPGEMPKQGESLNAYPCTIGNVESVDAMVEKAKSLGGRLMLEKMAVPGLGWLAYLWDTEGNSFGVLQEDKSAK